MTSITAIPVVSGEPPYVRVDLDTEDPAVTFDSISLERDGVLVRTQPSPGSDKSVVFDYDAPYGEEVIYTASGYVLPPVGPSWTESWADLSAWTGDTSDWSVGGGEASSSVPGAVISRTAAGGVQRVKVDDPSGIEVRLKDGPNTVASVISRSSQVQLTTDAGVASVAGTGGYTITLSNGLATVRGASWSTSLAYSGEPDSVSLVSGSDQLSQDGSFSSPAADFLATDPAGNVYLSYLSGSVQKRSSSGALLNTFPVNFTSRKPYRLAVDSTNMYITARGGDRGVVKVSATTGSLIDSWAGNFTLSDIALGSTYQWVVHTSGSIRKYSNSTGNFQTSWSGGSGFLLAAVDQTADILYVVNTGTGEIKKWDVSGSGGVLLGTLLTSIGAGATGIEVASDGNLWVSKGQTIYNVDASSGATLGQTVIGASILDIAVSGTSVYVTTSSGTSRYVPSDSSIGTITVTPGVTPEPFQVSTTVTLGVEEAWLVHPSSPSLSVKIADGDVSTSCMVCASDPLGIALRVSRQMITDGTAYVQPTAPPVGDYFRWTGAANASTSEKYVDGELVATNLALNPSFEAAGAAVEVYRNKMINPDTVVTGADGTPVAGWGNAVREGANAVVNGLSGFTHNVTAVTGDKVSAKVSMMTDVAVTLNISLRETKAAIFGSQPTVQSKAVTFAPGVPQTVDLGGTVTAADSDGMRLSLQVTAGVKATIFKTYMGVGQSVPPPYFFSGAYSPDSDLTAEWVGTADASESRLMGVEAADAGSNSSATNIQSGKWAESGAKSLRIIPRAIHSYVDAQNLTAAQLLGKTLTVTATSKADAVVPGASIYKRMFGLRLLGYGPAVMFGPASANTPGEETLTATFTIPNDPAITSGFLRLYNGGVEGSPDVWWDDVIITEGTEAVPYFSGDSPSPAAEDLWIDTSSASAWVYKRWDPASQSWVIASDPETLAVESAVDAAIAQDQAEVAAAGLTVYIDPASDNSTGYAAQQVIHEVIGSNLPIVVTSGRRRAGVWVLILNTCGIPGRDSVVNLLDEQQPILLQIPPDWGYDLEAGWYAVGDLTEQRLTNVNLKLPYRQLQLPLQPVARPSLETTFGHSWGDLLTEGHTWATLEGTYVSWLNVLTGGDGQ